MFDQQTLQALAWAALGCGFTWLMTTAGSAVVLFTSNDPEKGRLTHHIFLGFAAGVMIAASVWSLLNPAIEQAEELGQIGWIPAAGGFLTQRSTVSSSRSIPCCPTFTRGRKIPRGCPRRGSARRFWSRRLRFTTSPRV